MAQQIPTFEHLIENYNVEPTRLQKDVNDGAGLLLFMSNVVAKENQSVELKRKKKND
jgi:hypothetical protein